MYRIRHNSSPASGLLILITLFMLFMTNGCYVPLPGFDLRDGVGTITKEAIGSLKQGKSTRADVLLLLGNPEETSQQDRFFIYTWEHIEGAFGFGYGYSGAGDYVYKRHFFCIEFDDDSRIKRYTHIKSGFLRGSKDATEKLYRWMNGEDE